MIAQVSSGFAWDGVLWNRPQQNAPAQWPFRSLLSRLGRLSESEIEEARDAKPKSAKRAAVVRFAREIVAKKGPPSEADFETIRLAGFSDCEIAEVIAHVALNIFTNYVNDTAGVEVDFPKIALRQGA